LREQNNYKGCKSSNFYTLLLRQKPLSAVYALWLLVAAR